MSNRLRYACEIGDTQGPQGESGKLKLSETSPIEGKRSFEVPSSAPTTEPHRATWTVASGTLPAGANNEDEFLRFYVEKPGDPSTPVTLCTWGNLAEGRYLELICLESGKFQLKRNGSTVVGETAGKVANGKHYGEIRLRFGTTTSNGQAEGRVDGESFAVNNATNLGTGLSVDQLRIGVCNSTGGPGGLTWRFDAIAINNSKGTEDNSYPGALKAEEPPKVVTGKADGIGGAIATLHGTVNPRGLPTDYWFEIGEDETYGSKTAAVEVGDGEEAVAVEADLTGLDPETTYHFRLVAENEIGETEGEDGTFETGPGPSGDPVAVSFLANHEGDPVEEYGSSGIFEKEGVPMGTLSSFTPGYGGGKALRAETTAADSYARGIAIKAQTGWLNGQEVYAGCAVWFPKGFFEAMQGQVDILRWDNFEQDSVTTERGGIVIQTGERRFRFVRIKEGEPDEQHSFNLKGEAVIGPELQEERWYFPEFFQRLWHEDYLALNKFYLDDRLLATSTERNCTRADLEVSRLRAGIVATSGKQTNPLSLVVDRVYSGPRRRGPLVAPRVAVTREAVPDRLAIRVADPETGATIARWAEDESNSENVFDGLKLSGELNGGRKEATCGLARDPRFSYSDLTPFLDVEVYGPGVETVWDGRVDKAPESDGERKSIDPAIVGHQAALEDNKALIGPGFIDGDLSKWGDPSTSRRKALEDAKVNLSAAMSVGWQGRGEEPPGVTFAFKGITTDSEHTERGEAWNDGGGVPIGVLLYHFARLIGGSGSAWYTRGSLSNDDLLSAVDNGTEHDAVTNSNPYEVITATGTRRFARLVSDYDDPSSGTAMTDLHSWELPKLLGTHGLALQGEWPDVGFTAKQMLAWAVREFTYLEVDEVELEDDGFVIPQAWFADPGSMLQVVEELTKYGLLDWFVRGKKFNLRFPGTYGRRWQAYAGPSGLKEQGLDASRLWRSIVVRYTDVDGSVRTVGPPGSGALVEDPGLELTDPEHPAVQASITRQDVLDLNGIGTQAQAIATGERWLEQANLLSRSGSCTVSYYLLDDKAVLRPVSQLQEGDLMRFPDAHDTSYRRIVSYEYTHETRSVSVTLDAPKESISALLERFNAKLSALGI